MRKALVVSHTRFTEQRPSLRFELDGVEGGLQEMVPRLPAITSFPSESGEQCDGARAIELLTIWDKGAVMAEKKTLEISYPDGSSEGLLVSPVGPNLYRLEESSMLGEAVFGDVIEAVPMHEGGLLFKRVASPSGMTTVNCILTPEQMQAPGLQPLLDGIMSLGGNWERALDGLLMVHLPPSVALDIEAEIKGLSSTA